MRGPLKLTLHLLLVLMIGYNIVVIHSKKTTCTFTVTGLAVSTQQVICTEGDTLNLHCNYSVTKNGKVSMCWGRESCTSALSIYCTNVIIKTDGSNVIERTSNRYQLLGNIEQGDVSLTITNVTEEDKGPYCCRVEIPGPWNDEKSNFNVKVQKNPTMCVPINFCTDTDNCTTESSKCCCKEEGYDQIVRGSTGPQYTIECSDIDECFLNSSICGPNRYCVNTVGSYSCVEYNTTTQQPTQRTSPVTIPQKPRTEFNTTTQQPTQRTSPVTIPQKPRTEFATTTQQPTQRTSPVTIPQKPRTVYEECLPKATQGGFMESCASQVTKDPLCYVLESSFRSLNKSCQTQNITIEKADRELLETTERFTQALTNFSVNAVQEQKSQLITELLYSVEQNVLVSFLKTPRAQKINTTDQDITMKLSHDFCSHGVQSFSVVSDDNIMEVPCILVPGDKGGAILIAYKRFDLFTPQVPGPDNKTVFNSKVVTGTVTNANTQNLSSPIIFSLSHLQPLQPLYKVTCVFWDPVRNGWSDEGCDTGLSEGTYTNCSCTHLSSFALLMALEAPEKIQEDSILTLLSYIGLSLSLLSLCLSLLTFILCRSLRSSHTSILIALCGCLFLGQLLLLVGIRQTGIKLLCAFIAGCLQFSFLCAFCWMSIESFLLFMTVRNLRAVNYMASRKSNFPLMCLLGFGIPAVIVGITAAVHPLAYGTDSYCWLNLDIIWSFLGPVCVFIIANTVLLALTVYFLRKRLASVNTNVSTLNNTRLLTFKAVAQLFILGCTWGIGYFQFGPHPLIFSYLFTICNSLQGVYIFLVHCLLNQQVRGVYRKLFSRKKKQEHEISTLQTPSRSGNTSNITMPMTTISSSSTENKAQWK